MILAFGVGVLVGQRACGPAGAGGPDDRAAQTTRTGGGSGGSSGGAQEQACAPKIVERVVQAPPQIIYECPPKPEPPPRKVIGKAAPQQKLPDPEPELDPLARRKLLAWVRERSDDLKPCRDDTRATYRVAVILHPDPKTGRIARADVNADRNQVPGAVLGCLQRRILRWRPPAELLKGHSRVMFGLTL